MKIKRFTPAVLCNGIQGTIIIVITVILSPLLRLWYRNWGVTRDEVGLTLPGDDIVPEPKSQITIAISVHKAPGALWPWIIQLGSRRAGWYSYDLLDNSGYPSAGSILPEYQHLDTGDLIYATRGGAVAYPVATVKPERHLILGGTVDTASGKLARADDPRLEKYFSGSLSFLLADTGRTTTRFIVRQRLDWNDSFFNTISYRVFLEPVSFVMGRKMVREIKRRAETVNFE